MRASAGAFMFAGLCFAMAAPRGAAPPPPPPADRSSLQRHVSVLAGDIGERNLGRPEALEAAARYVEGVLRVQGYDPGKQEYETCGFTVRNIVAEVPGAALAGEVLVVGAHYDSAPGTPGADDNATGVAGLLEIARLLAGRRWERTLRFVAFVNEEPPFFQTDGMGSRVYARSCRARGERVAAMLCLETIGYYSAVEGSQAYPFLFRWFYPSRGDFLALVGDLRSRSLVREGVRYFREVAGFPSEGAALPRWLPVAGLSDHWSFWKEGYRAVLATDTAPFRYPHYHGIEDTPDKVDYVRLTRVVGGLAGWVTTLARAAPGPSE